MNTPSDWNDLAKLWQADAACVPVQDIDAHLQRERRRMWRVSVTEFAGLTAGIIAAVCLLVFTPHVWLGVLIILFGGGSAWLALRMRRQIPLPDSLDLMQSLKDSIAREDWITEQLRFGRVLSFVALAAIVLATSMQLLRLKTFSATGLVASGIGCTVVLAALALNLVLSLRSRRRRARLRYLDERLKA